MKKSRLLLLNKGLRAVCCFCFLIASMTGSGAPIDAHEFADPRKHALYVKMTQELRCPKCLNQNILDSNSEISIDLRNQVARLVKENQTEPEIKAYMVARYGDFVLYEPPLTLGTALLWYGPGGMFVIGALVFAFSIYRRNKNAQAGLTDAKNEALDSGAPE